MSHANSECVETIPLQLRAGKLTRDGDRLIFRASDGPGGAAVAAEAEIYLQALIKGTDLETLILDHLSRGHAVDYRMLKTVVLALYHGGCFKNQARLRPHIESWQQPPLQEPTVITPLGHARPSNNDMGRGNNVFVAVTVVFSLWFFLLLPFASKIFGEWLRFWLLAFLLPSTVLSLNSMALWVIDTIVGKGETHFGARISPMGFHFETDGRFFKAKPVLAFAISSACAFVIPGIAWRLMRSYGLGGVADTFAFSFVEDLTVLLVALSLLPGLRTPLALARAELMKRGLLRGLTASPALSGIFITCAVLGLCATFGFAANAVVSALRMLFSLKVTLAYGGAPALLLTVLTLAWSALLLIDLLMAVEALADDVELVEPLRESVQMIWTRLSEGLPAKDKQQISTELDRHPLFTTLPPELRQLLTVRARILRAPRGARLIRQGARTTDLYLLISGTVGIYKRETDEDSGELVMSLRPGSVFGESGFFLGEPRTADVVTLEKSVVIRIPRPPTFKPESMPEAAESFKQKIWGSQVLVRGSLFQSLPTEALLQILNTSDVVSIAPGEMLMKEGDPSDSLWICIQGSASVRVKGAPRGDVREGAVLGEIGLIWNSPRTATITAKEKSLFLRLSSTEFRRLVSRNLNFGARLQELGSQRLERDLAS